MILFDVFERYVKKSQISVMARAITEVALAPDELDALFQQRADKQYAMKLMFSSMVDLLGVVVSKSRPSIHAAYQEVAETLPVSITAYDKLNGLEPAITGALVHHSAHRLAPMVVSMQGQLPALVPGYRARIIDGNENLNAHAPEDSCSQYRSASAVNANLATYRCDSSSVAVPCELPNISSCFAISAN
jgi:hypothetical protein